MIKFSQKRTCNDCMALRYESGNCECLLKYSINDNYNDGILYPAPKEHCPKPKTIMDFYECREWYMR